MRYRKILHGKNSPNKWRKIRSLSMNLYPQHLERFTVWFSKEINIENQEYHP